MTQAQPRNRPGPCAGALAAALLVLPAVAGAIVNGAPASPEKFAARYAWAVALEDGKPDGVCTGQLVSPTWVLTAGHCTNPAMRVRVGHPDRGRAATIAVVEAVRHPLFDAKTGTWDAGLLRLAEAVDVAPVAVATTAEARRLLLADRRALIAGWGKRGPGLPHSPVLVVSDVELRELQREESRFAYYDPVSGPCGGDSGGPLLLERADGSLVLAGIASRVLGNICAQGGGVGIYTDVAAVRPFIEQHVHDLP